MPTMIYHAPFPLNWQATSASGIRPVKMFEAFQEPGYRVIAITGYAKERRQSLHRLRKYLQEGGKVDFLYSESATIPASFTQPHHFPLHLLLDARLFQLCRRYQIPAGLFYRDIYWAFPEYITSVPRLVAPLMRALYRFDLRVYQQYLDIVYLPSMQMAAHVPIVSSNKFAALPPGTAVTQEEPLVLKPVQALQLLYVGGLGGHYDISVCLQAVAQTPGVELTICTHKQQWENVKDQYAPYLSERIRVVHESGAGLEELYRQAHLGVLYVQPIPYRDFAAPVKLYEYLGQAKPIIASQGTLSGDFVADNQIGWSLPYEAAALAQLLKQVVDQPQLLQDKVLQLLRVGPSHTWVARARQVATQLGRIRVVANTDIDQDTSRTNRQRGSS